MTADFCVFFVGYIRRQGRVEGEGRAKEGGVEHLGIGDQVKGRG